LRIGVLEGCGEQPILDQPGLPAYEITTSGEGVHGSTLAQNDASVLNETDIGCPHQLPSCRRSHGRETADEREPAELGSAQPAAVPAALAAALSASTTVEVR